MKKLLFCLLLTLSSLSSFAQTIPEIEFANKDIRDILIVLAKTSGVNIRVDETVSGISSHYFAKSTLEEALEAFLSPLGLYWWKEDGTYLVSRVRISPLPEGGFRVDAINTQLSVLLDHLSKSISVTIFMERMPGDTVTLHQDCSSVLDFLSVLLLRYPEYAVKEDRSAYSLIRKDISAPAAASAKQKNITLKDGVYSVSGERVRFRDLLLELFRLAGKEFSLLGRNDSVIDTIAFADKDFDTMLNLLLPYGPSEAIEENGIYFILDVDRNEYIRSLSKSVTITLEHYPADRIAAILPAGILGSATYKIDTFRNAITLTGSPVSIASAREFLSSIDIPAQGRSWIRYELSALSFEELVKVLPPEWSHFDLRKMDGGNAFLALLSTGQREVFQNFLAICDRPVPDTVIPLRYRSAADFIKAVPTQIGTDGIKSGMDDASLHISGSRERISLITKLASEFDRPVAQIRYVLLVLQNMQKEDNSFDPNLDINFVANPDASMVLLGSLSKLAKFVNFDFIKAFGFDFSINLDAKLSKTNDTMLSDTTILGLSGETVKFQNTSTSRYPDTKADSDGNLQNTGAFKEISNGIIISIDGWVAGDGMISMDISATLSDKLKEDTPGTTLPSTSEQIVDTHIRTPAGVPIVIGGLNYQKDTLDTGRIPILGSIPFIGKFFTYSFSQKRQTSNLTIYIIPYIEPEPPRYQARSERFDRLYAEFFQE